MTEVVCTPIALRQTVSLICGRLEERRESIIKELSGHELRIELIACLLGSQVRAESANAAVDQLSRAGLLTTRRWLMNDDEFEHQVRRVLAGEGGLVKTASYRFPTARARQIAELRSALQRISIREVIDNSSDPRVLRRKLVRELPGIGPKQASMFLRNIGASYDLAILDVHVLRFLQFIGVLQIESVCISALNSYERVELLAKRFADSMGKSVGLIDWAIWITMKAASEMKA